MFEKISALIGRMAECGAKRFYAKRLAPNDNSKNQIYLGGDFSALNIIPHQGIYTDNEEVAGSKRNRAKARILFSWVDEEGLYEAPNAQLILYPKYPEVRMSGFLKGCRNAPSNILNVRDEGRIMFLGVTDGGRVIGYAVDHEHPLAKELASWQALEELGVFLALPTSPGERSSKSQLLRKLKEIHNKLWIPSQKLGRDGKVHPYVARNGGGYTLEAELGIAPNGYAEPDFLGWEIKQFGVRDFRGYLPKGPVTLMTPEPSGGIYKDLGVPAFMNLYGYQDKNGVPDRLNFGGIYSFDKLPHKDTGLRLAMLGYDLESGTISDIDGGLALLSKAGEVAALWRFSSIMDHWNRKHAQAAYIPSMFRKGPPAYAFGAKVLLCEKTDFNLFLGAVASGAIYYDPAIKIEQMSSQTPKTKRRSQFRVKHQNLPLLYKKAEEIDLMTLED
ncbi:hypothetical protein DYI21_19050 [Thalassospira tepidiphila]|jgi:hypothetical protein|uniref:MvaI/BcnI family restriction endonuclease n=1 Tax=Thalassospira tepidiphila TaxID=393657 RepID=UPI001BCAEDB2|nr:MvaI/BcnI family restriction endonuclease [Thalassospira tepidiphila]MBS8275696.1 hypothetical protein [Thalassospira tepidiphila]